MYEYGVTVSDILDTEECIYDAEPKEHLGFSLICRQCDNVKNITYSAGEIFDGEGIDVNMREIYCTHCGNKIK